jgi:hypothetical protein
MKPTGMTAAAINGIQLRLNNEDLPIKIKNRNAKKKTKKPGTE